MFNITSYSLNVLNRVLDKIGKPNLILDAAVQYLDESEVANQIVASQPNESFVGIDEEFIMFPVAKPYTSYGLRKQLYVLTYRGSLEPVVCYQLGHTKTNVVVQQLFDTGFIVQCRAPYIMATWKF